MQKSLSNLYPAASMYSRNLGSVNYETRRNESTLSAFTKNLESSTGKGDTVMSRGVRRPAGRASSQGVSNGDAKCRPGRSLARTVYRPYSLLDVHAISFNFMFLASD